MSQINEVKWVHIKYNFKPIIFQKKFQYNWFKKFSS